MVLDRKVAKEILEGYKERDLREIAEEYSFHINPSNKGWQGQLIERILGLAPNPEQAPDFDEWELKMIPIKCTNDGGLFKETMAITMINEEHIRKHVFEDSHLLAKLKSLLLVVRVCCDKPDGKSFIKQVDEFDLEDDPELYQGVKDDYDLIRQRLLNNEELCSKLGNYIQPRTKGRGGNAARTRAFYARKTFLRRMVNISI